MAINFPSSPNIGDEHSAAGKTWTWNGSQWEGVPTTAGIPYGTTANRPVNPELGQPFFNADEARLEMYTTATGWQNIVQETPAVVSISGVYAAENTSNTITINGTNFAVGAIAYAVGTDGVEIQADTTTLISVVEVSATFSGLTAINEPYDIKVVNPSNLYGILYETLQIDDIPVFLTQSGTLGTYIEESPMSVQISVTDDENSPLIFSITSGSFPTGLAMNSSTGLISGTPTDIIPNTTYGFTVSVTDGNNTTTRNFDLTVNDRGPVWQTSQTLSGFSKNISYTQSLSATDDNGISSYSVVSGSLPTGLSLNSSTGEISGTPTSDATAIFTVRATDIGGNYADRQFTISNAAPVWQTSQSFFAYSDASNSIQLSAIDDSGINPTYSIVAGNLPSGVSLSSSGLLTGTSQESSGTVSSVTIRATDNNGEFSDRNFSITTSITPGQALYTSPGTYSWVAPANVTSVSVVAIGGGGGAGNANSGNAGGGGGLGWKNNISVNPGQSYTVVVGNAGTTPSVGTSGAGSAGGTSYFINTSTVAGYGGQGGQIGTSEVASGGSYVGDGGGSGGFGGSDASNYAGCGGGGAGGYTGNGGYGGGYSSGLAAAAGTGGAGGGGGSGYNANGPGNATGGGGGGGGGVGVYGAGSSGAAGITTTLTTFDSGTGGGGGSNGGSGGNGRDGDGSEGTPHGGSGGQFGGGSGSQNGSQGSEPAASGAVRIIWGAGRAFPSTNTQDM